MSKYIAVHQEFYVGFLGNHEVIYKPANKSATVCHCAKICCRGSGSNRCGAQQSEISLGSRTTDVQSWPVPICITLFLKRQQQFSNSRKSISQISKSFFLLQFFWTSGQMWWAKWNQLGWGEQDNPRPVSACSKFAFWPLLNSTLNPWPIYIFSSYFLRV